jgi:Protein of unknown function (DUF1573)
MKRLILLLITATLVMTTSCKKEDSTSKTNSDATEIAPTDSYTTIPDAKLVLPNEPSKPTPPPADGKYPELSFEKQEHDFGTITQGDKVSYEFKFKNTGEGNLIITDAKGSCGCTVPEYPKTPIKPGEDGKLKVSFDSAGKIGLNTKSVTLTCNTKEGKKIINIKANIEPSQTTK